MDSREEGRRKIICAKVSVKKRERENEGLGMEQTYVRLINKEKPL